MVQEGLCELHFGSLLRACLERHLERRCTKNGDKFYSKATDWSHRRLLLHPLRRSRQVYEGLFFITLSSLFPKYLELMTQHNELRFGCKACKSVVFFISTFYIRSFISSTQTMLNVFPIVGNSFKLKICKYLVSLKLCGLRFGTLFAQHTQFRRVVNFYFSPAAVISLKAEKLILLLSRFIMIRINESFPRFID